MTRAEAKEMVLNNPEVFLKRAKKDIQGKPSYICPICENGTGKDGTGITEDPKNPKHYKCFKCGEMGDIIHFIGKSNGLDPASKEAFNLAYDIYNIDIENDKPASNNKADKTENTKPKEQVQEKEVKPNYTEYIKKCYKEGLKNDTIKDYLASRGIKKEAIKKYNLGYDKDIEGLIIPTAKGMYKARYIKPNSKYKYMNSKGSSEIFNISAIQDNSFEAIFIVEGELDAISVMEADENIKAVGLGSIGNKNKLIDHIKKHDIERNKDYILLLDSDEAGRKASIDIEKTLKSIGYSCTNKTDILRECKDPNEALIKQREDFILSVINIKNSIIEERKKEYLKLSAGESINEFINGIKDKANTPYTSTGFNKLDKLLDGGLYEGLYIVGAISSLGKTSLVLQIADQMAQQGQDVLIFSLEMSKFELMAKSISRETIIHALNNGVEPKNAKTVRGITTQDRYKYYNNTEKELITSALKRYSEYANHLFIYEGLGDIGVNEIKEKITLHKKVTGNIPVVIIDYLQILAPYEVRATDKQNTDKAVLELKRISRDFKTPVIGISSFNRVNYDKSVSMLAFKESGAIEYSSDVLIGLQFKEQGTNSFDVDEAKKKTPRDIELKILKNRNGQTGTSVCFNYYALFNHFEEE